MRLGPADLAALRLWLGWRVGVAVLSAATAGIVRAAEDGYGWLERWYRWDAVHFVGIAEFGYTAEPTGVPNEAFLPGLPLLMRLGSLLGMSEVAVGVVVSLLASAVAAVALARLAERAVPGSGSWSVASWLLAPTAIFLAAPYTESLFLALALPAWLAAQDRRWWAVGVLAALAMTVRVSALFLLAALVVQWVTDRPRRWTGLPWLLLPAVPLAAVLLAQHAATGSWTAWWDAQASDEWNRYLTPPWEAAVHTWEAAFTPGRVEAIFVWPFRLELVAMAAGVAVTVWCLLRRWWGEATFVGLNVAAFAFSYWFFSVPRAALLWWPLWIAVASVVKDRPWLRAVWLGGSGALAAAWAVTFLSGGWAG